MSLLDPFGVPIYREPREPHPAMAAAERFVVDSFAAHQQNLITESISMYERIRSTRLVNEFGDRLARAAVGLPPPKFDGGAKIDLPLQWKT